MPRDPLKASALCGGSYKCGVPMLCPSIYDVLATPLSQSQLCSNALQFAATFLKQGSPAATPEISRSDNVAYESYNRGKDQDDDHQYEKLDEYKA